MKGVKAVWREKNVKLAKPRKLGTGEKFFGVNRFSDSEEYIKEKVIVKLKLKCLNTLF